MHVWIVNCWRQWARRWRLDRRPEVQRSRCKRGDHGRGPRLVPGGLAGRLVGGGRRDRAVDPVVGRQYAVTTSGPRARRTSDAQPSETDFADLRVALFGTFHDLEANSTTSLLTHGIDMTRAPRPSCHQAWRPHSTGGVSRSAWRRTRPAWAIPPAGGPGWSAPRWWQRRATTAALWLS